MADILKSFEVSEDGVSLNDEASIIHGATDPSTASGQSAPIGSIYLRTDTPELYQKSGATDTDWTIVNSAPSGATDIPVVQLRRSATQAITTSFTDINFDITDMETDVTVLEHDPVNIDRILIKDTGLYGMMFSLSIDANSTEDVFNIRVRVDDTTVIPISNREISEDDEINAVSNAFFVYLTAGQFVTLQIQSGDTGDLLWDTTNFIVYKVTGKVGAAGPPGTGSTVNIQNSGVSVPNTPHTTINFQGEATASDAGGGVVDVSVPAPIFGSEFTLVEAAGVTSTTSTSFQNKLTAVVTVPAGQYRCGVAYGWNFNSASNDFNCRIQQDGVDIGQDHRQEPKDAVGSFGSTGTNQKYFTSRTFYTDLAAGTYTFTVDFRSRQSGTTASIWDVLFEMWRVT